MAEECRVETTIVADEPEEEEEEPVPEIGTWMISDAAFRGTKCLHIVGACYRLPKVHYKMWTVVADPVCSTAFKRVCKTCFPEGYPWEGLSADEALDQDVEAGMLGAQEGEEDSASEASFDEISGLAQMPLGWITTNPAWPRCR